MNEGVGHVATHHPTPRRSEVKSEKIFLDLQTQKEFYKKQIDIILLGSA